MVVQNVRAAATIKTRVRMKCMVKVIKFGGRGCVRLKLLRDQELREQLDSRHVDGEHTKYHYTRGQ